MTTGPLDPEAKLRAFILSELQHERLVDELPDDFPLIKQQVIDSMAIYQIITFIECEFGVEITDDELLLEYFGTIGRIARLVASKLASARLPDQGCPKVPAANDDPTH